MQMKMQAGFCFNLKIKESEGKARGGPGDFGNGRGL